MSESYYNQAPVKDARFTRKLAKDANDEINIFQKEYRLATEKNERQCYER